MRTIGNLKDESAAILSGLDITNVDGIYPAIERAARILVQNADVPEATIIQNFTLYNGVTDYACDTRIFGTAIKDIRPVGISRNSSDFVYKKPGELFDRTKGYNQNGTSATFEYQNGTPIIRIVSNRSQQKVLLDSMNNATGWGFAGNISQPIVDTSTFYAAPASLRFNMTSGSGSLSKMIASTDLTQYNGVGVAFLAIDLPVGADITKFSSIKLTLASSGGSAYVTSTAPFVGTWTTGSFVLVPFDFSTMGTSGTLNWSGVTQVTLDLVTTGNFVNLRVGNLWITMPTQMQILAQTAAIFKAVGGSSRTNIVDDADEVILNDAAYTIFTYEVAKTITQQMGATLSSDTIQTFDNILWGDNRRTGLYQAYRGDNPSEEIRQVGSYYDNN